MIVGYTELSESQVLDLFEELKTEFVGASYNALARNCNTFSQVSLEGDRGGSSELSCVISVLAPSAYSLTLSSTRLLCCLCLCRPSSSVC